MDSTTIKRSRDVSSKHLIYIMSLIVCNNYSYQQAVATFRFKKTINHVPTSQAINKKILTGNYKHLIDELNQELITKFFNHNTNDPRYIAVDGSKVNLSRSLVKDNYQIIGHRRHSTGMVSTLYDIKNQIPLTYQLTNSLNERIICYDQVLKLSHDNPATNDIIIGDRGYYSSEVVSRFYGTKMDFIFRMKKSINEIKHMETLGIDDHTFTIAKNCIRIIRYFLPTGKFRMVANEKGGKPFKIIRKTHPYYLGTSLLNQVQYPIERLKELYHQRWSIEEYYKNIKSSFCHGTFHSILPHAIDFEMSIQVMICLLTRIFLKLRPCPQGWKNNYKVSTTLIINKILYKLLFNQSLECLFETCLKILPILETILIAQRVDRHFPRVQRFHYNKFFHE